MHFAVHLRIMTNSVDRRLIQSQPLGTDSEIVPQSTTAGAGPSKAHAGPSDLGRRDPSTTHGSVPIQTQPPRNPALSDEITPSPNVGANQVNRELPTQKIAITSLVDPGLELALAVGQAFSASLVGSSGVGLAKEIITKGKVWIAMPASLLLLGSAGFLVSSLVKVKPSFKEFAQAEENVSKSNKKLTNLQLKVSNAESRLSSYKIDMQRSHSAGQPLRDTTIEGSE
jgi:hypothetical protein